MMDKDIAEETESKDNEIPLVMIKEIVEINYGNDVK
jgi:hypothetical protein